MTIAQPDSRGLSQVATLMTQYMAEAYRTNWHGSPESLRAAVTSNTLRILIATHRAEQIAGFVAWTSTYDLHWCVAGGTVLDLYVCPEARGRAVAIRLLAAVASQVRLAGGSFLRGTALDTGRGKKLYSRAAVCSETTECTVSGRAFRDFAELEKLSSRDLLQRLPDASWNYEA